MPNRRSTGRQKRVSNAGRMAVGLLELIVRFQLVSERLQVGWARAFVRMAFPFQTRCYRCLRTGHTRSWCKDETDRSARCFNCGGTDHAIAKCKMEPRCPLSIDVGEDVNHRLGDPKCICPSLQADTRVVGGNET